MKILLCVIGILATAMADADPETLLKEGNIKFTARMYTEVAKQHQGQNIIQSAYSVQTPLAQLALASVGESHEELLKALNLPNDNVIKEAFSVENKKVRSAKGIVLKMANKVYIPQGYHLNEQFAATTNQVFDSEVQNIDFRQSNDAANTINAWVEEHTNKRIKGLVSPDACNSDTQAMLINAIYFKGKWRHQFKKSRTKDDDFYVTKDETVKVPFMSQNSHFLHGNSEELDATLLQLPYEGNQAHFLIILPNKVDGLTALEEKLKDPAVLRNATSNMWRKNVEVYLPRFKIETTTNLKTVLINMGIKKLFGLGQARLENLLQEESNLYISDAMQKAFIEVNEEGSEAAAGNAFQAVAKSLITYPFVEFRADHPFVFAIKVNDAELFMGRYVK